MYITRFAHRMDFGEKTNEVCVAAMRLVSRMKRDWIHTGRRPSGLCGAALLVAARLHGYSCSLKDVVRVVRIGHDTIRKRLTEFVSTPSSQLTINEFMNIDLESEADPPSFTESRLKQKHANMENIEEEIGRLSNAIEARLANPDGRDSPTPEEAPPDPNFKVPLPLTNDPQDEELEAAAEFVHSENPEAVATKMTSKFKSSPARSTSGGGSVNLPGPSPTPSSLGLKDVSEENFKSQNECEVEDGELDLTSIDDEEIDQMILSENESVIKTRLWMAENGEYMKEMEERQEKRRLEEEEREKTRPRKPKRKTVPRKEYFANSQSAGEAIEKLLHRNKLSSKIDYDALKRVTEEPKPPPTKTGSKFLDTFSHLEKYDVTAKVETQFIEEPKVEIGEPKPKARKKEKVTPCLNPFAQNDTVKSEVITETGPVLEVTEESGPIAPAEDEIFEDYEDDEHCLSASQLMQEAGVGDSGYGGYNYDGYEEYD